MHDCDRLSLFQSSADMDECRLAPTDPTNGLKPTTIFMSSYHSVPARLSEDISRLLLWTAALLVPRRMTAPPDGPTPMVSRTAPAWSRFQCCRLNVAAASAADLTSGIFSEPNRQLLAQSVMPMFLKQQSLPRRFWCKQVAIGR